MSQEEIDALVGSEPDPLTAAAAPAPAPAPVAAAAAPEPEPAAAAPEPATPTPTLIVSADSSGTSALAQRLASLEATVAALQQSVGAGQNDPVMQALSQQVQALSAQMNQLMRIYKTAWATAYAARSNAVPVARRARSVRASRVCTAALSRGSAGRRRAPRRADLRPLQSRN